MVELTEEERFIVDLLKKNGHKMTRSEIEIEYSLNYDQDTLQKNLKSLKSKGIITFPGNYLSYGDYATLKKI